MFTPALALLLAACGSALPQEAVGVDASDDHIVDRADLLTPAEEERLETSLQSLEDRTSDQLVVVTIQDLEDRPIEQWGLDLGNDWGVGHKDLDNGVLLIVAPSDRQARIEVGLGLEGLLTDQTAQAIIDEELLPHFRKGDFAGGIDKGVVEISELLMSDTSRPQRAHRKDELK